MVLYYETRKQYVFREERKDETGNENMFWFEVEDRVSGEGLKEVGSK